MPGSINCSINGVAPHHGDDHAADHGEKTVPARLVLCLDGTGNLYSGNTSDTNIVN